MEFESCSLPQLCSEETRPNFGFGSSEKDRCACALHFHRFTFGMSANFAVCWTVKCRPEAPGSAQEMSWSTGAVVHGGVHGLRSHFQLYPRYLACVFRHFLPKQPFTSLCLSVNVQTKLHLDRNNALGSKMASLKLVTSAQMFDAHHKHLTMP